MEEQDTGAPEAAAPETSAAPEAPHKSTAAERMAKARAAKAAKRIANLPEMVSVKRSEFDAVLERLRALEQTAKIESAAEVEITPETKASTGQPLRPGQYINLSSDPRAPDFRKVRWTKASIEETYQMVDFTPLEGMTVVPHGVQYDLVPRVPTRVPSIVKSLHDAEIVRREWQFKRYEAPDFIETYNQARRAMQNPGERVWGRLHIVGQGLDLGVEAGDQAPIPAEEAAGGAKA